MKLTAVRCGACGEVVYSRARYDWHRCSCGETWVDGGPGVFRYGYKTEEPEVVEVEVDASVDELFDDWAEGGSKWGGGLSSAGYEVEVDDR